MHSSFPKPSRPVNIVCVHIPIPKWNKCSRTKCNHVHIFVFSVILSYAFCQNLAAPIQCIRPANAGCGNEYYFVDTERGGRLEYFERPTHVQVKEIIGAFHTTSFVNTMPGRYVDNA